APRRPQLVRVPGRRRNSPRPTRQPRPTPWRSPPRCPWTPRLPEPLCLLISTWCDLLGRLCFRVVRFTHEPRSNDFTATEPAPNRVFHRAASRLTPRPPPHRCG